ncbi:DRAP deaminase [Glugoides intestinalis]
MEQIKYFHTYETHVKLRWMNKPLIEVLVSEFTTRSREYYIEAINKEVITVNNKRTSETYKLKDLDIIRHTVHIHEPIPPQIEIIDKQDEFWVVNKPSGIPCHPTGGYFEYSITRALFKDQCVGCINRLDMPVSGVLIITLKNSNAAHNLLKSAEKVYVAKVKGDFPDSVTVDKPVGLVGTRIFDVSDSGKSSITHFKKIEYKNGMSLIECRPITGRTHQIRIHCKYLGFPIINDILYGEGESTGFYDQDGECNESLETFTETAKYECIINNCKGINNRSFKIKDSFICLHAWKYKFNKVTYEAPWPAWAHL